MYIQSVGNCPQTTSYKGLYFTKTPSVGLKDAADFLVHEKVTTTKRGIQYMKDTDIPKEIKKRFAENKYIKKMARKYDTFIWFGTSVRHGGYGAWAKIMKVKDGNTELASNYVIGRSDLGKEVAVDDMFAALKDAKFTI